MIFRKAYYLQKIYRNQWISKKELDKIQLKLLKRIVKHAYTTVPYYNRLFRKWNLHPDDIKELRDINKIPITSKKAIKKLSVNDRVSSKFAVKDMIILKTSGSTGTPLDIYCDKAFSDLRAASIYRTYIANEYRYLDKIAILQFHSVRKTFPQRVYMFRKHEIPYTLSLSEQIKLLEKINPQVLEGYPSRINQIACQKLQNRTADINPRVIITNSETITDSITDNIANAFGLYPTGVYDCWEFGNIAWECPKHEGLHINADLLNVQIMKDNEEVGNNETGKIIVTDFCNFGSPLLRYEMEDLGIKKVENCSCGRVFPLIRKIIGRQSEMLVLSDGREIEGTIIISEIIKNTTDILEYQAIQRRRGDLEMNLVVNERFNDIQAAKLRKSLLNKLHLNEVKLRIVDEIKKTKEGKLRTFISEIKQ